MTMVPNLELGKCNVQIVYWRYRICDATAVTVPGPICSLETIGLKVGDLRAKEG